MVPGQPAQSKALGHHEGLRAMLTIRVFVSSPGDVAEERRIAVETLRALEASPLLRERVNLLVVAWDDPVAADVKFEVPDGARQLALLVGHSREESADVPLKLEPKP
jgi:hypothetical protein